MRADKTRRQPALYGRDSELRSLWDGFRRATAGRLQFVTVAGPAGIGKSSLINKFLHELPVTAPVAYGRTTPQQHFIPYRALSNSLLHVLQDLYGATLDGDVSLLSQIKYAFKSCGGIAADALPGGAGILGRCEDSRVAVSAKEKHFRQAFLTVVSAIPTGDYPLVLVLEDLHWADSASLLLLEYIFANCFHARVLLIVSYRNGSPSIPLKTFLAAAVHFAVQHEALLVLPLTHDQLVHFVTDRLGATIDASKHLAALIMGQTQGNPFAIESCLRRLNDAKTATSDLNETGLAVYPEEPLKAPEHYWRAVVADASKSLSQVLYALACIGRVAEPRLLADVLSLPRSKILLLCAEAEYVGLLVQDGPAWRFAHDIIAQIAYEKLCSVNGVEEMHCRIGIAMHLIVDSARDVVNFEVVTQLNKGASASIGALGADQIFLLNVAAGRKAKETWAYAPAEHYFSMAHQLSAQLNPIPAAVFSEVCRNLGECAGLRSSFEKAERFYTEALLYATHALERVAVQSSRAQIYGTADRFKESIAAGIAGLKLLGESLGPHPSPSSIARELESIEQARGCKSPEELAEAPPLDTQEALMRLDLYGAMFHASYCYNPPLFVTNRARIIATCFVDGSSRFSALAFMSYGVHLCCQRMSTQIAQRFAKQALAYQLRTEDSYGPALVLFLHTTYILQFALDPHAVISRMEQDLCAVDALGDTNWGSIFRFELLLRYLLAGVPLDYLVEQCGQFEKFAIKRAGSGPAITIRLLKSLACCFSSVHESCPFCTNSPQNSGWAPDALKPEWSYNRDFFQMLRFYLRNDFVDVCTVGGKLSDVFLRDRLPNIRAHPIVPAWCLLYGLAICRCVLTGPAQELTRMRRKLTSLCDELNWWSKAGPNHYEHDAQFLLGAAAYACGDRATASFNITAALDAYEKSRSDLKAALAAEFLGYVHLTDHNQKVADIFLTRALAAYSRWGAVSKVKELNSLIAREDEVCRASEQQGIAQHELTTLSTAVAEVSAAQNMPTLMATVQRIAGCWTGTERQAFVLLIEGKMISSAKSTQAIQKPMEENSTDIPVNVARKVLQSGKIFHIFDSSLHSDLLNDSYFTKRPARSLLCLPVAVGDELLGLLYLEGTPGHSTFSGLVSFLSILVAHAAGRIQYMMLQQTMLDQMKHYSRNLEGAQDRLIRFNRMALETQMAGGFAHEMRNILASASVVADAALRPSNTLAAPLQALVDSLSALYELCENNLPEPKRPEARHLLQQAVDSALFLENALKGVMTATTRGLKLTSETLEYARSGGVRNRPREAIEMAGLLNGLVEELRPQFSKFHVRLDLDLTTAPVVLAAFEPDLYAVFKNLLVNAFDAVCSKADLVHRRVCVIMRTVEAGVNIQISDSGIGIAKKDARRIYEPFFSTKETGTGLGLAVVKKLIDMYEGTIECRSVYGEGTNFTVVWPSVS